MFSSEHARSDERTIEKHNAFGPICRMVGGIKTKCSTTESADGVNIASRESSVRHIAAACRSTRDIFLSSLSSMSLLSLFGNHKRSVNAVDKSTMSGVRPPLPPVQPPPVSPHARPYRVYIKLVFNSRFWARRNRGPHDNTQTPMDRLTSRRCTVAYVYILRCGGADAPGEVPVKTRQC